MSYHVETNNETGLKYMVDVKRHSGVCSIDGCLARAQRNSLCTKHLRSCGKTMNSIEIKKTRMYANVSKKKRSNINPWSTNSITELSADNSNVNANQIQTILSKFQHHLEHNVRITKSRIEQNIILFPNPKNALSVAVLEIDLSASSKKDLLLLASFSVINCFQQFISETYVHGTQLNAVIDDDTKSESSVEYDYTNQNEDRYVSIATINLQDKQWHQLELFIKHFSSHASLSNNMNINSSTTHLLIDDSSNPRQCIFSKKIFQAAARSISIVSIRWIEECLLRNEILDETPFEIHGDGTMSTLHLTRHSSPSLLFPSSVSFIIDCMAFQQALTRNELTELVLLTGATLFVPEQVTSTDVLLILVDPTADRFLLEDKYKQCHKNMKFLTPGFLLKSIVYQKQQPFEDFEL